MWEMRAGVDGWGQDLEDPKCQVEEFGLILCLGRAAEGLKKEWKDLRGKEYCYEK